jgi:4-diphosphocytidyl-2-C-methyl-D-erythritol kinase
MKIRAYAKINLGLRVVGKRSDRFHNIETIFHRVNLFDELTLLPSPAISLSLTRDDIPNDYRNLCWKAVELLQKETRTSSGVLLHIVKSIPVGAGLGGGSSDAAAVLCALPQLWNVSVSCSRLESLALQLGSDVPFFLHEGSAYATGRGEILHYRTLKIPYWIVLVTPNISINTSWAYRELSKEKTPLKQKRRSSPAGQNLENREIDFNSLSNDFERVVIPAYPRIGEIKTVLHEHGALAALMSGSGSSVFGLFEHETEARQAAAAFKSEDHVSITEPNFIPTL